MQGYETGEACCVGYFGEGNDCSIVDLCAGSSSAAAVATVAPAETTEAVTTTEKTTTTAKATSQAPPPDETTVSVTTTDAPFVDIVRGFDSFDDLDTSAPIPWIHDKPLDWVVDNQHVLAGTGALRNVAPVGSGAQSDLTLKIRTEKYSMIRCYAFIDVAMPWEFFTMTVNGTTRYAQYSPIGEWVQVATGLAAGESTITFTVKNPAVQPPDERTRGSGFVWLDVCEIVPMN